MPFKKRNTNENGKSDDAYDEDELLEEEYAEQAEDELEPVSYTHLDVYKRQLHTCVLILANERSPSRSA